jgi:hypothetical protein
MRFIDRDLTEQYISMSYQDVLQQYVNTGSLLYVLDGYGNVVFGFLSSSVGDTLVTTNMTSSLISYNLDGGSPSTVYGGTTGIDGGSP